LRNLFEGFSLQYKTFFRCCCYTHLTTKLIYKSSVGFGDNYAIFDDEKLNGIDVEQYEVSETRIEVTKDES